MQYFVPDIRLASQLPEQKKLEDKLGGLPWGLPLERWPRCAECDGYLSMVAQLNHDQNRLDLGRLGRVLFVFQCNYQGVCETWSATSGANACLIVEPEVLVGGLTQLPCDDLELETEARVVSWVTKDDGVPAHVFDHFFDDDRYYKLPDELLGNIFEGTRLGSVPMWIQCASESPAAPYRFVGQLDSAYNFFCPLPSPDEIGCQVGRKINGSYKYDHPKAKHPLAPTYIFARNDNDHGITFTCDGPNFGDAGIGYIFISTTDDGQPDGRFFWQCT